MGSEMCIRDRSLAGQAPRWRPICAQRGPMTTAQPPAGDAGAPAYLDPGRPLDERVADLLARLTLDEKIDQLGHSAPAVPRLGIPAYNW
mgnify:CR=1 FL=1